MAIACEKCSLRRFENVYYTEIKNQIFGGAAKPRHQKFGFI
jgi:hypothetical protein